MTEDFKRRGELSSGRIIPKVGRTGDEPYIPRSDKPEVGAREECDVRYDFNRSEFWCPACAGTWRERVDTACRYDEDRE